jgi:hypothetical protein
MLLLTTFSANAFDRSMLGVTAGIAANQSVFGATAKQTNNSDTNTRGSIKQEHGVFTDSHKSGFIELNVGQWVSIGYEHTPDSISTPENKTRENTALESKVSVDFNDLNTTYLKVNLPFATGMYARAGVVSTDLDIKETMGSGSTYSNVSTDGTVLGLGYNKLLGDSRVALRIEGSYLEFDDVMTSNGVSSTGASVANSGRNQIDGSNLEGLSAKVALTITLGNLNN